MEKLDGKLCSNLCEMVGWKNSVESCVESCVESWVGKVYSEKYTVYSVQCTMYNKVVLLSLLREPQCSSVWRVEPFAHKVSP